MDACHTPALNSIAVQFVSRDVLPINRAPANAASAAVFDQRYVWPEPPVATNRRPVVRCDRVTVCVTEKI